VRWKQIAYTLKLTLAWLWVTTLTLQRNWPQGPSLARLPCGLVESISAPPPSSQSVRAG
jgi:hypothetical protein